MEKFIPGVFQFVMRETIISNQNGQSNCHAVANAILYPWPDFNSLESRLSPVHHCCKVINPSHKKNRKGSLSRHLKKLLWNDTCMGKYSWGPRIQILRSLEASSGWKSFFWFDRRSFVGGRLSRMVDYKSLIVFNLLPWIFGLYSHIK